MLSPANKRPATSNLQPSTPLPSLHPCVSDDLAARLRSLGSRIRKQVTEGYATSPSPDFSPSKSPAIFQSAKDTLREVYRSQPATPVPSPKKRPRSGSESEHNDDSNSDLDMEVDDELPSFTSNASRPVKPLRKPKSAAMKNPDVRQ